MCLDSGCQGDLDRRDFLRMSGAGVLGLGALSPKGSVTPSQQPPTRVLDDPRAEHGTVVFKHGGKDTFDGFLARPKKAGAFSAVLVVAGNRITEEYIPNTCAALALADFVGLAPNIFHPLPDSAKTSEEINAALKDHTDYDVLQDIQVAADYLRTQPFVRPGGLGVIGFCFGGRMALLSGARFREVDAVVPFHPGVVTAAEMARLKSPVQVHCGTADRHVSVAQIEALRKLLEAQSTPVEVFYYEGADHGFLAYTRPFYRPDHAQVAWRRVTEFLGRNLR